MEPLGRSYLSRQIHPFNENLSKGIEQTYPEMYIRKPFHGVNISSIVTDPIKLQIIDSLLTIEKICWKTQNSVSDFDPWRQSGDTFACVELAEKLNPLAIRELEEIAQLSSRCFGAYKIENILDRISIIHTLSCLTRDSRSLCLNWTLKLLPFTYSSDRKEFCGKHVRNVLFMISSLHIHSSFEKILKDCEDEIIKLIREHKDIDVIHQAIIKHLGGLTKAAIINEEENSGHPSAIYTLINKAIPV